MVWRSKPLFEPSIKNCYNNSAINEEASSGLLKVRAEHFLVRYFAVGTLQTHCTSLLRWFAMLDITPGSCSFFPTLILPQGLNDQLRNTSSCVQTFRMCPLLVSRADCRWLNGAFFFTPQHAGGLNLDFCAVCKLFSLNPSAGLELYAPSICYITICGPICC